MKSVIRIFALLVAVVGLASASFAPATTQALPRHVPVTTSGSLAIPAPLPCQSDGTCLVQPTSNR